MQCAGCARVAAPPLRDRCRDTDCDIERIRGTYKGYAGQERILGDEEEVYGGGGLKKIGAVYRPVSSATRKPATAFTKRSP